MGLIGLLCAFNYHCSWPHLDFHWKSKSLSYYIYIGALNDKHS